MAIEHGTIGRLPFAALGTGEPVLVIAGLSPVTGPGHDRMAQATIGSLAALADRRRLVLVNRRAELRSARGSAPRSTSSAPRRAAASPSSSRPTTPTWCAGSCC
jgi:hypothetical protein